jgi:hypothetical protein
MVELGCLNVVRVLLFLREAGQAFADGFGA